MDVLSTETGGTDNFYEHFFFFLSLQPFINF